MAITKEYKDYTEFLDKFLDVQLTVEEKHKLKSLGKDWMLANKTFNKMKNHLANKALTTDMSREYIKWALYMLWYLKWLTK